MTAEITIHRGTEREQRIRKQIPVGAKPILLNIELLSGRRQEVLQDAQIANAVAVQQEVGRGILAQQLAGIANSSAAQSLSQSRSGRSATVPQLPFLEAVP